MSMIRFFAAATLVAALGACSTTSKDTTANPGAVSGGAAKAECCGGCSDKPACPATGNANMGAVSGKSDCSSAKSCGSSCSDKASMGAVSGKSDCSSAKSCGTSCSDKASMGAVSGKSDCSSAKSCGDKASMGAVSGKTGCCPGMKSDC
jgi:hypothetical protein